MHWFYLLPCTIFIAVGVSTIVHNILLVKDRKRLANLKDEKLASSEFIAVSSRGYKLIARWTPNAQGNHPVCIPNGLGATIMTIGKIHDSLSEAGFSVLSYDRVGVGFSENEKNPPSVEDCIEDMYQVMKATQTDKTQKWILLGPSMGSIVAQSFMKRFPDLVSGFLNMDGLPHPFYICRAKFLKAATVYKITSYISYTGITRILTWLLMRKFIKQFESDCFSVDVILTQMNLPEFYYHVGIEFPLMMDLAEDVSNGWGVAAVEKLDFNTCTILASARPTQNGKFLDNGTWETLPRSNAELGDDWESDETISDAVTSIKSTMDESPLGRLWKNIIVRVLSARQYNYFGGESFYDKEMKRFAAAEHSLHFLVAKNGCRYVFPEIGHNNAFLEVPCITQCIKEIQEQLDSEYYY